MARTWHDDLAAPGGDPHGERGRPVQAKRRARLVRAVVEAATAHTPRQAAVTAVRCVAQIEGRDCGDWIHVARDRDGTIAWSCPGCGENGFVVGFDGGPHDLGRWRPSLDEPLWTWAPTEDELALLDDASDLRPDLRATLARAVPDADLGLVVAATHAELDALYAFVAALVDSTLAANRLELLDLLRLGLTAALEASRDPAQPRR